MAIPAAAAIFALSGTPGGVGGCGCAQSPIPMGQNAVATEPPKPQWVVPIAVFGGVAVISYFLWGRR